MTKKTCLALSLAIACTVARADLEITVSSSGTAPQPIAVVPFAQPPEVTLDLAQVVAADLDRSGLFRTLPRSDMLEKPTELSQVNLRNWRAVGMDDVVIGKVQRGPNDAIRVSFRLLDALRGDDPNQALLLGMDDITAPNRAQWRSAAHRVADQIYQKLTGVRGIFDTRIAYIVGSGGVGNRRFQLYVADADGENPRVIATSREPLMSPAWSPDGSRIAYVGYDHGNSAIYIQTPATGALQKFVGEPGINGAPAWSPDGRKLAVTLSYEHNPDIYVIDLASGAKRRITTDPAIDTEANWSPDGKTLAFVSDRGGQPQIYTVPAEGGTPQRITFQGVRNEQPRYSPDGKSLALVNSDGHAFRIGLLDLQTRELRLLSDGPLDEGPNWAPNGQVLIYTTQTPHGQALATVSVDGRVRQILSQPGDVREPAWAPFASTD